MSAYFDLIQILFSILEEGSKKGRHQIKKKTRCILNITKKYVLKLKNYMINPFRYEKHF